MKRWTIAVTLTAIAIVGMPSHVGAWGKGHRLIRLWAVSKLTDAQKAFVGKQHLDRLCSDYTSLQDKHAGGKAPELDPYCIVPGVRLSLHDVNPSEPSAKATQWFLEQILDRLADDETDKAMKYLGVLCHWHEDPGCPSAHCSPVRESALKILLPPTPDKENLNYLYGYGGIADVGNYKVPDVDYRPRLLGTTVKEAALRMVQHQRLLERQAAARIVPIVQDMIGGDGKNADEHRAAAALENAKHVADVIHTVLCLARDEIDPNEFATWLRQPLAEWLPDAKDKMIGHPYYVTPYLTNQAMDAERNLHPLALADGEAVEFGYGMGAPFQLDFTLAPGDVMRRFTCRVGLHPVAEPGGEVSFRVCVNGVVLHETESLRAGDASVSIDVAIPEAKVTTVTLETVPTDPADSKRNLAVWAEPTLHRE